MGKATGFIEYKRENPPKRDVNIRTKDYEEVEMMLSLDKLEKQAARCMDCGVPHCHYVGCPLGNRIPDFNDMVYQKQWKEALELLHDRNNFPEITGRICPALCEASCTLSINSEPVTIKQIELQIIEMGFKKNWVKPLPPLELTGKKVAIVGSGPAGLAAAQQLARMGHSVTVFEKDCRVGGILRYGIPDFKLNKKVIDRRLDQMVQEGVTFKTNMEVGNDISFDQLKKDFDAILIAAGARVPRDLNIPGRELKGIHFAMEYLAQQNKIVAGDKVPDNKIINAKDKNVVVIGGGDTGSDCVGTANRQGAKSVVQIELLPKPPDAKSIENPWPNYPLILRTSSSHDEGCERIWSVMTKEFIGTEGNVNKINCVKLDWKRDENNRATFSEIQNSDFILNADLVFLAMGFLHVEKKALTDKLGINTDDRGNIITDKSYMTSVPGIFAAGDSVTGASLVVHAINIGRKSADSIDKYLMEDNQ